MTQRYMHLSPAALDAAIQLLDRRGNMWATAAPEERNPADPDARRRPGLRCGPARRRRTGSADHRLRQRRGRAGRDLRARRRVHPATGGLQERSEHRPHRDGQPRGLHVPLPAGRPPLRTGRRGLPGRMRRRPRLPAATRRLCPHRVVPQTLPAQPEPGDLPDRRQRPLHRRRTHRRVRPRGEQRLRRRPRPPRPVRPANRRPALRVEELPVRHRPGPTASPPAATPGRRRRPGPDGLAAPVGPAGSAPRNPRAPAPP